LKILFLSSVFYPDNVSVSQHLTDWALYLTEKGHKVTVYTSCYPHEQNEKKYSKFENFNKIKIFRLYQTSFGKSNAFYRIIDFFSFYISLTLNLFKLKNKEFDIIFGTSVPPMLSVLGVFFSKLKKIKFYYWLMDMQPELSISSGLIKKKSITAKILTLLGNYSLRNSEKIFSMDRYMSDYLFNRVNIKNQIFNNPPWSVIENIYTGTKSNNPFRIKNNFGNKIVVMYSGNHSYVHPLDTLLESARQLKDNSKFLFVFVGEGVRKKDVSNYVKINKLNNIIQLPFQPRSNIHISLSSADIQVVIMGNNLVGYTHPNKIYGGLYIGRTILYIGPKKSHITDLLGQLNGNIIVEHEDSNVLTKKLLEFSEKTNEEISIIESNNKDFVYSHYNANKIKDKMYNEFIQ
tara:strand:+ start:8483 stop:9694 length:1212 start_codon:yes stop_codon:yes gene_type:complete